MKCFDVACGFRKFWPLVSGTHTMNWDQIEGSWKQVKGKAKEQWGRLTDDELDQAAGRREQLIGKVQERYGYARDRAESEVDEAVRRW
jgi:uncharacterized protein YjbJ (UPF0337 family)